MNMKTIATSRKATLPNVHPGKILRTHFIEPLELTQRQVSDATGLPVSRINDLVKFSRGVTVDSAIRLGRAFGIEAQFWLNLQIAYEMEEAVLAHEKEYDRIPLLNKRAAA
jgi:addiction module HigA family antidote